MEYIYYLTHSVIELDDIQKIFESRNVDCQRVQDFSDAEYPLDLLKIHYKWEENGTEKQTWIHWESYNLDNLYSKNEKIRELNSKSAFSVQYEVEIRYYLINLLTHITEQHQGWIEYVGHLEDGILDFNSIDQLLSVQFYPTLSYFFSGYFHQFWNELPPHNKELIPEWNESGASFQLTVKDFKYGEQDNLSTQAIQELKHLLNQNLNEDRLRNIVNRRLGSFIYAPGLNMTYQEWLEAILELLQDD